MRGTRRRRFALLAVVLAVTLTAVAGCSDDSNSKADAKSTTSASSSTTTSRPPATTTAPATTAPATTGGGGAVCTQATIQAGVDRGDYGPAGAVTVNGFACSGEWAYASISVQPQGNPDDGYDATALVRWSGSQWDEADRAVYCQNGSVPQAIYQPACTTN